MRISGIGGSADIPRGSNFSDRLFYGIRDGNLPKIIADQLRPQMPRSKVEANVKIVCEGMMNAIKNWRPPITPNDREGFRATVDDLLKSLTDPPQPVHTFNERVMANFMAVFDNTPRH